MTLDNILLDSNGNCKISNFDFNDEKTRRCSQRSDIKNLGYLVFQMITGKLFFIDKFTCDYSNNDLLNELVLLNISDKLIEFFKLTLDGKEYPEFKSSIKATLDLKNDPFFKEIDWIKLEMGLIQPPFVPNKVNQVLFS